MTLMETDSTQDRLDTPWLLGKRHMYMTVHTDEVSYSDSIQTATSNRVCDLIETKTWHVGVHDA